MNYLSDFVWLFSTRASRIVAGVTVGLLTLAVVDGGRSAGQPAGAWQLAAEAKTHAARKAALERIAAFVDKGSVQVQPAETGVPGRRAIIFKTYDQALSQPSTLIAQEFSKNSEITGSVSLVPVARPTPPIDTLWRLNAAKR